MRSRLTFVAIALACISVAQIGQFDPWLIVPAESIGYTRIGAQMGSVYPAVQAPNGPGWEGDAAMGHRWAAWVGRIVTPKLSVCDPSGSNCTGTQSRGLRPRANPV